MPRIKRSGDLTVLDLQSTLEKKPKLQEKFPTAPTTIGTLTINGNQKISYLKGDHLESAKTAAIAYAFKKTLNPRKKKTIAHTQETNKLGKMFIFPKIPTRYTLNPQVLNYLNTSITLLGEQLENFLQTVKPELKKLDTFLNKQNNHCLLTKNKDANLTFYLETAYTLDQFIQDEIQPLIEQYNALKTNFIDYINFDDKNETLILIKKFIDDTDIILIGQKTFVSEQVESTIANKAIDALPLKPEIKAWLETIKSTMMAINTTPIATCS